jgi:predicted phage terminase large subunit-like protein
MIQQLKTQSMKSVKTMKIKESDLTPEQIARSSLLSYMGLQYPKYRAEPAHELIATALEAVEAGTIKRLLIFAPPQHGKCCDINTLVHMADGTLKKAGDIKVGDCVFGYDNGKLCTQTIVATELTKKQSKRIATHTGHIFIGSTDHPLLTFDGYKPLSELTTSDFLVTLHHKIEFVFEQVIEIKDVGIKDLVHLQTTNTENYIANGIVSHNTMIASEFFPAWAMGRNPDWKIIAATFNQTKANEVGAVVRDQFKGNIHKAVFPNCIVSPDVISAQHVATEQRGHYYSIGLSGTGTGRGANCLTGDTKVQIKINNQKKTLDIATLYQLQYQDDIFVLAFDHKTNAPVYKRIVAKREVHTDEIYKITTDSGNYIRSTGNHGFFISGRGYINAKNLRQGDRLTCNKVTKQQDLRRMWEGKKWQGSILQGMLHTTKKSRDRNSLLLVREKDNKESLRNQKSHKKRAHKSLLFIRMFYESSRNQEQKKMYCVWKTSRKENTKILFSRMQRRGKGISQNTTEGMSSMWSNISTTQQKNTALQSGMCRSGTFNSYDGKEQFTLQGWNELLKPLYKDETFHSQTRQCAVCNMWNVYGVINNSKNRLGRTTNKKQHISTPYRRRSNKQYPRKFNMSMHNTSYNPPQIDYDTISSIERISRSKMPVYDIQVEETNNFFANEILVHNCILIDDPFKGREDAESKLGREKVKEFYKSVAYSRLRPGGRIVIINTRWVLDDLSGYVQSEFPFENWKIIDLKAIAEEGDILGRKVGEALCPNMYPLEELRIKKLVQGTYNWESLYQQRPIPREGGMIKYEWIENNYYTELPKEEDVIKTVVSWDTAYRPAEINDPTAATVWQITKNGYYLIDVFNKKLEFYKIIEKVKEMQERYHASAHLIEGRATGQTVIDELKRTTTIPVVERSTKNLEKGVRLDAISGLFESGKVWFPESAPWLLETKDQLCLFPSYKYDDITDSVSQFLNWVNKPRYVPRPPSKLYWK